jgi:hypothetical protein
MDELEPLNFNFGLGGSGGGYNSQTLGAPSTQMAGLGGFSPIGGNWLSNMFGGGGSQGGGLFSANSMFGGINTKTGVGTQGWVPIALGLGQALFGAMQGRQAVGLAKDQFKEARRQFDLNFDAQRKTTNTALEDRQRARVASNPTAYQSVEDYMNKNRV